MSRRRRGHFPQLPAPPASGGVGLPVTGHAARGWTSRRPGRAGRTPARSHVIASPAGLAREERSRAGRGMAAALQAGPAPGRSSLDQPHRRGRGLRRGAAAAPASSLRSNTQLPPCPLPSGRGHSPYYSPHRKRRRHAKPEEEEEEASVATATNGPVRPRAATDMTRPGGREGPLSWSRDSPSCPALRLMCPASVGTRRRDSVVAVTMLQTARRVLFHHLLHTKILLRSGRYHSPLLDSA